MVQEAYVQGISTRSVDDLVRAMGMEGISKARSRDCAATSTSGCTRPITEACATREAATSSVTSPRSFSARFHGLLRIHVCRDAIPLQGAIGTQRINLGSVEVPGRWHATHYFLPGM